MTFYMKNNVSAISAIALLFALMACAPEDKNNGESGGDKSLTTTDNNVVIYTPAKVLSYDYQRYYLTVVEQKSYTPVFDAEGRLVSIDYKESGYHDKELVNIQTSTETYKYDNSGRTALATAAMAFYNLGSLIGSSEIVTSIAFDDDGRIQKAECEDYAYSNEYTYNSGYLVSTSSPKTNYTWDNGDLKSIVTDYITDKQTVNIEYSSEINPFAESVDPVLCSIMPDHYCFGLLGRRTAHLPSSYTMTSNSEKQTLQFEYDKDEKGRIEMVKIKPSPQTHHWRVVIHYED